MKRFKVGGRELALVFTLAAMDKMEEAFGQQINLEDIQKTVVDATNDRKKLVQVIFIMAEEGAALNGEPFDLDAAWFSRHMRPGDMVRARLAVLDAVTDGMSMEAADDSDSGEIDLVLEELKKKQEPGA